MKILVDTHTHTNCSTHAHSTLLENATLASERGLEMLCMTDHTPALPDAPHLWHFQTMQKLPDRICGVRMKYGAEANLIDMEGHIDLPDNMQADMDLIIASIHDPCLEPGTVAEHTNLYIGALKNPYITILGHSGKPKYAYDIDTVVACAKEYNKCIEINNHTFNSRKSSAENCRRIALACKKHGTKIVVSSDAHFAYSVGVFDKAVAMLEEIDFPEELIVNTTAKRFEEYLNSLRK